MRRGDMHHDEVAIDVISNVVDRQIKTPISIRAELLKALNRKGNSEKRSKTPQIEVDTPIDDWSGYGRGTVTRGLEADGDEILGHRTELGRAERAPPVRTIWWIEPVNRIK